MQFTLIVNVTQRTTHWQSINWHKANKVVRRLRQRIFKATTEGKLKLVRNLQRLLMRSYSNILLSVRKVTQINSGKNTPGVNKLLVKTPEARGALVDALIQFIPWKPLPTKRVYIPKANGKQRLLGIPCIIDRVLQAIIHISILLFVNILKNQVIMKYKSIASEWDIKATVRSSPYRELSRDDLSEKWLYSQELVPVLNHTLLNGLDDYSRQRILAKILVNHLNFTNYLEHDIVNKIVFKLAHDSIIDLSIEMRRDAYRIYVDEAYHSLIVSDLRFQVEELMEIQFPNSPPPFYWNIKKIISQVPRQMKGKALLCVAIVSETLISKLLEIMPKDTSVAQGVSDVIADHAHDEKYHCRYFTKIFQLAWPQFREAEKIELGCLLPKYIYSFLIPDYRFLQSCLLDIGLSKIQAKQVIHDSYNTTDIAQYMRTAASTTLKLFRRYAIFEDERITAAFIELKLLSESC